MTISIIAISGSLRSKSTNTLLLREIEKQLESDVSFTLYDDVEALPQFNPDKESMMNSQTENWIHQVRKADIFIASSPEYAHGIPGAFKNALDWLVGTDAFIEKPFCLYSACPRHEFSPQALLEVLKTMSGVHIAESDVSINLLRNYDSAAAILSKNENKTKIRDSITTACKFFKESTKLS